MAIGNSMLVFTQNFGGAVFLSFAELIFSNTLATSMTKYAPSVDTQDILTWGATGFREHISGADFTNVLTAYNEAIVATLYLGTGAAVMAFLVSGALGWKSVKQAKVVGPEA